MRYITLALMCLSLIGCRTTQQYLFSEINPNAMVNSSLMLESVEEHEAMIREFMVHHPNGTEQEKIQFLLSALKNSKLKFRRNGSGYDGNACAKWLAWKMKHPQFRDDPILTGWDFVRRVADRSKSSGKPYEVIFPGNRHEFLITVLSHELNLLERALRDKAMENVLTAETSSYQKSSQGNIQAPMLLPVASAPKH